jgi:aminoglycoside phosphotransferase (APT) family kinase protein
MPVTDAALSDAVAAALQRPVRAVARHPFPYSSSYRIEQLDVTDGDGRRLSLLFKDLSSGPPNAGKPAFAADPLREIGVYELVLGPGGVDAPACLGAHVDAARDRAWLFLELLEGRPLWQIGDNEAWTAAARWLAGLHERPLPASAPRLLRYDAVWFGRWLERARARTPPGALDGLARGYQRVIDRLTGWPPCFVHGEFYPANVLLQSTDAGYRVRPLDWEMAGIGPGLLDLAALTAGGWGAAERRAYALAYFAASPAWLRRRGEADFLDALEHCRLHVAIQWLGWSAAWEPPGERAHDWLAEAVQIAAELGL